MIQSPRASKDSLGDESGGGRRRGRRWILNNLRGCYLHFSEVPGNVGRLSKETRCQCDGSWCISNRKNINLEPHHNCFQDHLSRTPSQSPVTNHLAPRDIFPKINHLALGRRPHLRSPSHFSPSQGSPVQVSSSRNHQLFHTRQNH